MDQENPGPPANLIPGADRLSPVRFTVTLEAAAEGGFTAQCVEIPGAIIEGETERDALANIVDAIASILSARRENAHARHAVTRTVDVDVAA